MVALGKDSVMLVIAHNSSICAANKTRTAVVCEENRQTHFIPYPGSPEGLIC
jgi:hypothetical protein